ncbi:hypothetical protein B0H67DRAFT_562296 [Lasiosphaeris hirsuta]|uniref:Uncharacterized protein n=1 Tax=Lasiosphaeris hirsuta TaxID=260670 RepID=A0AA40E882_9PEZI|nr:hypothetical protein B0H67DRAFT_562296 [Lasiosphaeris hirsuta]
MTGKRLSDFHRQILSKLLQIQKLTNHEIAFVLGCDERTIRRRRYEFAATGNLAKGRDVSKNAEKLKPQYLEKLLEWLNDNEDALLEDMQSFLKKQFGLEISIPTISRQLKSSTGTHRRNGRARRIKIRELRQAEGRPIDLELRGESEGDNPPQAQDSVQGTVQSYEQHEQTRFTFHPEQVT